MQATLIFYMSTSRGERKILGNLLINTFVLILSSDFAAKRQQVAKTSEQLSRQQLFAQHDAKNLAQFISLLDEQIRQVRDDQDRLALFDHIHNSMPVVVERARRLHPRSMASRDSDDVVNLELHAWMKNLSSALGLKIFVHGDDVEYHGAEKPLYEALKNVLENFQQHTTAPHSIDVQLMREQDNIMFRILAEKPDNLQLPPAERMFEPFYSTSKSGMGLGLYLARSALAEISGTIHLVTENNHYGFLISVRQ